MRYPEDYINNILCGDSLELIKGIPDNSYNFVFTDPPYNVGKDYGDYYTDDMTEEKYTLWMKEVIKEANRISNNNIAFFVGSKVLKLFWDLIPNARLIIVHKRAIGSFTKNYFRQYFGLLTTSEPKRRAMDLWNNIRLVGEGYYFREKSE